MGTLDVLLGSILALAGAYIFLEARTFPNLRGGYPGPGLFPQILGVLFILSGLGITAEAVAKRVLPRMPTLVALRRREVVNALLVILAVVLYVLLIDKVGFIPFALLMLLGLMFSQGVSLRWSIVLGVGLTLAIYTLFNRILRVPLPPGILQGWL